MKTARHESGILKYIPCAQRSLRSNNITNAWMNVINNVISIPQVQVLVIIDYFIVYLKQDVQFNVVISNGRMSWLL